MRTYKKLLVIMIFLFALIISLLNASKAESKLATQAELIECLFMMAPDWMMETNQAGAQINSASIAGDVNGDGYDDVIIGSGGYDNRGRAFVFHGSASGVKKYAAWTAQGSKTNIEFGSWADTAGDVNGDGYDDVIISDLGDNPEWHEGRTFVYHGSAKGLKTTPAWSTESNQVNALMHLNGPAGDVNGDGYDDIIVGARLYPGGGAAFVYHGSPSGLNKKADWTAGPKQSAAQFGTQVTGAGDVNGDGYDDVIVGANAYDNGQENEGRVFVYHGSASGLSLIPNWTAESDQAHAEFGHRLDAAGDVNGDGYDDVIVGANWYDNGQENEGRVFVYHGSASGLSLIPNWTAESDQAGAEMGIDVAGAGDVNNDGYDDVIVGAFLYDNGETDEGRIQVYYGSASGLSTVPALSAESNQANSYFGLWVETAGDVNGDGNDDVIVAAWNYDNGETDEGAAFLYLGGPKPENNHCYQRFDNTMTWHDAKAHCESMGGYLATITSQQEHDFVYNYLGSVSPHEMVWLGATDETQEGAWEWVTNEPWDYTKWAGGEPNNCSGIEHYLVYFTPHDPLGRAGLWNDLGEGNNGGCGCDGCIDEWYPMSTICEWGLEIINDFVTFAPDPSTYEFTPDTTDCQAGAVGKFSFDATLTNISEKELSNLLVEVDELTNDNLLLTDNGLIGEGGRFDVLNSDDYVDGVLSHDEYVDVPFTVCLKNMKPFRFFVNVLGVAAD